MNITIYKSFSRSLHQTWKELEKNIELSVFLQFDWQKNWFKYIGEKQNYKLNIIIIEDKNSNKVISFLLAKKFGFKFCHF